MGDSFDIDMQKVRAFVTGKNERRRKYLDERFAQATADAAAIIKKIIASYNPKGIMQWGSLLDRRLFSEISDIDIAVEGIGGAEEFFGILGLAMESTNFPVDLVEIEKLPAETAARIRRKGKMVYERKG